MHHSALLGVRRSYPGTLPLLLAAIAAFCALPGCSQTPGTAPANRPASPTSQQAPSASGLPCLVDLGAGKCIPCKKMAPILDSLKEEYAGSLEVVFIDVWQDAEAGKKYGIESIPVQIFFDASGKELFRHEGFFAKEEILAKWKELGFDLKSKATL